MHPHPHLRALLALLALGACQSAREPWRPYGDLLAEEGVTEAEVDAAPVEEVVPAELRAARVLGVRVEDGRGEVLGELLDLALDPRTGRVLEVEIRGAGAAMDTLRVPWRAVDWELAGGVLLARVVDARSLSGPPNSPTISVGGEPRTVAGEVIEVGGAGDPADEVLVKLRDEDNRFHRVLLAPAGALEALGLALEVGDVLRVEGVARRDARGVVVEARRVDVDVRGFSLRDERGGALWPPIAAPEPATRVQVLELIDDGLGTPGSGRLKLLDLLLDTRGGRVFALEVRRAGGAARLRWSPLERAADGRFALGEPVDALRVPDDQP